MGEVVVAAAAMFVVFGFGIIPSHPRCRMLYFLFHVMCCCLLSLLAAGPIIFFELHHRTISVHTHDRCVFVHPHEVDTNTKINGIKIGGKE